jgi:ABC-type multidrug transport system ATPase subunit
MEVYQNVGITPQFDALWENLTVREHLRLFGNIKGLTGQALEE